MRGAGPFMVGVDLLLRVQPAIHYDVRRQRVARQRSLHARCMFRALIDWLFTFVVMFT